MNTAAVLCNYLCHQRYGGNTGTVDTGAGQQHDGTGACTFGLPSPSGQKRNKKQKILENTQSAYQK